MVHSGNSCAFQATPVQSVLSYITCVVPKKRHAAPLRQGKKPHAFLEENYSHTTMELGGSSAVLCTWIKCVGRPARQPSRKHWTWLFAHHHDYCVTAVFAVALPTAALQLAHWPQCGSYKGQPVIGIQFWPGNFTAVLSAADHSMIAQQPADSRLPWHFCLFWLVPDAHTPFSFHLSFVS